MTDSTWRARRVFLFTTVLVPGFYNYQRSLFRTNSAIGIYVCLLSILFLVNSSQLLAIVLGMVSAFSFAIGTELCIYTQLEAKPFQNKFGYIHICWFASVSFLGN